VIAVVVTVVNQVVITVVNQVAVEVSLSADSLAGTEECRCDMGRKRIPTDTEIDDLAERLGSVWRPGNTIRPWLRKQAPMLLELVHGDYSWDAIARAMTRAGILFATGRPWTARYLTIEFAKATKPLKGYARPRRLAAGRREPEANPPHDDQAGGSAKSEKTSAITTAEPVQTGTSARKFAPARLRQHSPAVLPTPEDDARSRAIDERLFGKKKD
jgi:hypothetical protein